jgi:pterin-4a-carbinolamine dehydratase
LCAAAAAAGGAAVKFFNQVAEVAEEEGHHPDLHLTNYREVQVGAQAAAEISDARVF